MQSFSFDCDAASFPGVYEPTIESKVHVGRLIKVKLNGRCHRFRLTNVNYPQLRHQISSLCFQSKPKEFSILFQDDDRDVCIISNQAEWEDALQCMKRTTLVLTIELNQKSESIVHDKFSFGETQQLNEPELTKYTFFGSKNPEQPNVRTYQDFDPRPDLNLFGPDFVRDSKAPSVQMERVKQLNEQAQPKYTFESPPLPNPVYFPNEPSSSDPVSRLKLPSDPVVSHKFDIGTWNGLSTYLMDGSLSDNIKLPEEIKLPQLDQKGYFEVQMWDQHQLLTEKQMNRLISFLDFYGGEVEGDFQVQFENDQALETLLEVDNTTDTTKTQLFAESTLVHPKFVLRRTGGPTEGCIDFHTDVSESTVQITLNGDDEYVGGRLCYVDEERKLVVPNRPKGTMTKHNKFIYHGVSKLMTGKRYSLFLIDSPSSVAMTATMDHVTPFLLREKGWSTD